MQNNVPVTVALLEHKKQATLRNTNLLTFTSLLKHNETMRKVSTEYVPGTVSCVSIMPSFSPCHVLLLEHFTQRIQHAPKLVLPELFWLLFLGVTNGRGT